MLAPNLTIYDKLIADFTPVQPKYVFKGIEEFAHQPPLIITGDNYEEGRGVRGADLLGREAAIINIFNISKINTEVRGGKSPRIKRLQEYIGESYFEYLAGAATISSSSWTKRTATGRRRARRPSTN